jgi:energy-coupling factor transporter ATP-binding protein EcfA2
VLSLRGVSYRYPGADHDTLHAVDLELPAGSVTGLVGPAESGKSTLCLVAGGLAPRLLGGRLVGEVTIDDADVRAWPMHRVAEQVVTALQDPAGQLSLMAETVLEEVALGPASLGLPREEVVERSQEALQLVGIEHLRQRQPAQLSGGEQQLVVMAGLLALRPRHLVLDEPVAHLDAHGARLVMAAVRAAADAGAAVLLVEQRTTELARVADRIAVVAAGNLVAAGSPPEVLTDPTVVALGVEQPPEMRLERLLTARGIELPHPEPQA